MLHILNIKPLLLDFRTHFWYQVFSCSLERLFVILGRLLGIWSLVTLSLWHLGHGVSARCHRQPCSLSPLWKCGGMVACAQVCSCLQMKVQLPTAVACGAHAVSLRIPWGSHFLSAQTSTLGSALASHWIDEILSAKQLWPPLAYAEMPSMPHS
jgi:hypothetical protein